MTPFTLQSCIDACVACAQKCERCANACLMEPDIHHLTDCIRLDLDCAQACWTTASYMSRGSGLIDGACEVCVKICELCAQECARHKHAHCKACAQPAKYAPANAVASPGFDALTSSMQ